MAVVSLILSFQWFDMIASGEKQEEYREIKPYYDIRFSKKPDTAIFCRGYSADRRIMSVEILDISKGFPRPEWSDPKLFDPNQEVYVLRLGRILDANFDLLKLMEVA